MGSITNLKENKTVFVPCDCKNEILVLEFDHRCNIAELCIYESLATHSNRLSLWQRFRLIINILIKGHIYTDQVILQKKQLLQIRSFLMSLDL